MQQLDTETDEREISVDFAAVSADPEESTSQAELARLLEQSVMSLPNQYRTVLMLRDVEELSTLETAATLGLTEENVKVRLLAAGLTASRVARPGRNEHEGSLSIHGASLRSRRETRV